MLSNEEIANFNRNGFLHIKNFLGSGEIEALKERIGMLATSFTEENPSVFSTGEDRQLKDQYFLESGNKIRFFLEDQAPRYIYNKCGHALHNLDSVFSEFSKSTRMQELFTDLGLRNPFILQSMYIFKNAGYGGEVSWHQDASFLYSEPNTLLGFWFALDDASRENGCLWVIPGGHRGPLRIRFRRVGGDELAFQTLDESPFELEKAVPVEVEKGSLIVLHSLLPHMSEANRSSLSRHAYTLHVYDSGSFYPEDNWLRV